MEDKIIKSLFMVLIADLTLLGVMLIGILILMFSSKYENTDVNHDGVTDIRDLAIVQKEIIEGK